MDNLGSLLEVDIKSASNEALASLFDTEDVSSTQCATVYSQKTNAIAEKGLSISSKLLEVGRLAPLAIKAELDDEHDPDVPHAPSVPPPGQGEQDLDHYAEKPHLG